MKIKNFCNSVHSSSIFQRRNLLGIGAFILSGILATPVVQAVEVAFEQDSNLPVVYLNVAIKAGSVSDPKGQYGLTDFMGTMLLRGTKSHTKEQIDKALDQMGAHLEVETRAEAVIFRGAVLSSKKEEFLKLLTEILSEPSFPESEITKLKNKTVSILEEERGNDNVLASRAFNRFLFRDHPYGKPGSGTIHDVQHLSRKNIVAHYDRLVRDPLLLVVGTGDAKPELISKWAESLAQTRPDRPLSQEDQGLVQIVPAPQDGDKLRIQIIDKPERTQTQINAGQIGVRMTDPRFFPLYVGNHAFGGHSFSAILMVEIRTKRGWSYGANSAFRQGLQPRSWHLHLFPAAKDTPPALSYAVQLTRDLREKGLTREQFDLAKQSLVNNSGFMYNTPKKRVENTLLEKTLNLPEGFMKSYAEKIEKVSLSDANQALRDFLKPEKMAITVVGTAKSLREPIAKALQIPSSQIEVKPYTQDE